MANTVTNYETTYEKKQRELHTKVIKDYLEHAGDILSKKVKPNRVANLIGQKYEITGKGVLKILHKYGVYISAKAPVVFPKNVQISVVLNPDGT